MSASRPAAIVEFCGEKHPATAEEPLVIGREGGLCIDDNPYLHRHFLRISHEHGLWWLANVGSALTATVADVAGTMQAWLGPGARLPLVFVRTIVWFTAGSTTYEFDIVIENALFEPATVRGSTDGVVGKTTIGRMVFTPDQKRLMLALCEPALLRGVRGPAGLPTSAAAAARLGWQLTRFNRKLDNVCDKLTRAGVRGLHGEPGRLAVSRRARLVEYCLAARLVERADLALLDQRDPTMTDDDE